MSEGDLQRERLLGLIDYVEATERDRLKVAFDFRQHGGFCKVEPDFLGLPGVELNVGDEDDPVWLRVQRLAKIAPPPPDDATLQLWVALRDDVASTPTLKGEIAAAGLIELGLLLDNDARETIALEDFTERERVEEGFAGWVAGAWTEWRDRETPRRGTIKLYNELYMLRQQLEGVSDIPVELVCGMGVATLQRATHRLRYPLLTMAMELTLDPLNHAILVRPRLEADPAIEIDPLDRMELHSLDAWRSASEQALAGLEAAALSPFDASTFEAILRQAAALLVPDGIYVPDITPEKGRAIPAIEQTLQVSGAFCFFQRERRATQLMEDLRRFRADLQDEEEGDFPDAVTALLVDPGNVVEDPVYPQFRGVSTIPGVTSSDGGGRDLFFPKPFNREQVEVVQRLETRPGVVVQGPPGTGKTHTIANIISHYLALGKRVLVTSQKAPALRVLRDKLPAAVRPLAVSLLDSDRDGLRQFQESVDIIAERLQRLRRRDLENEIADLDHQIDSIHRQLASIDHEVDAIGRRAIAPAMIGGALIEPVRAARMVVAKSELAAWLDDGIDADPAFEPQFTADDVVALRQARRRIGANLGYFGERLPSTSELPGLDQIVTTHQSLSRAAELRREVNRGALPELRDAGVAPQDALEALAASVAELEAREHEVDPTRCPWTEDALRLIRAGHDAEWRQGMEELRPEIDRLAGEAAYFLTRPVVVPAGALDDDKFLEAAQRLADGRAAIGIVGSLFAGKLKSRLGEVRARGEAVRDADGWQLVIRHMDALRASARLKQVWNHFVGHSIGEAVDEAGLAVAKSIQQQLRQVAILDAFIEQQALVDQSARKLFLSPMAQMSGGPPARRALAQAVEAHLQKYRLERAEASRASLLSRLGECEGEVCSQLASLCIDKLGNFDVDADDFRSDWQDLVKRIGEIEELGRAFETVGRVTDLIAASGAPAWAERLRSEAVAGTEDDILPGDWDRRWLLRRLAQWLGKIDQHSRLRELGRERIEKEGLLNQAYERSIELRTWLQLSLKATDSVKAALAAYADAIRRIGKGTGKRVGRYRREARAASDRAKGALPCWIMPHYRVSESLPAELGLFDLVIVDEASQSTLSALPALLRADKILIVGDDKQVSPEQIGRDQTRAEELAGRHLGGQVPDYRSSLREEKSLYDLGKVVFAGGAIMLTEHFRCVAPIIEFSKAQFYSHRLNPLRLPKASERLDPPLIDLFVEDGFRHGDINPPEADFIVSEIARIASDERMERRSIGVTTLLGQQQAAHIYKRIEQELGTEIMERHDVRVGDPTAFQGDERDIMFVSLVAAADDMPLSGTRFEQRFNVALSRARDRTYLVRSVDLDQLRPGDQLRRALLEHFKAPFANDNPEVADRRARCESDFEREMFDLLAERGYRVDTQVRVGDFRIDLVVEGEEDRRIAIECDGDRYHGPDKWPHDMMRQRILERSGWIVWRCFASRFVRQREAVVEEILAFLTRHGIAPMGDRADWQSRHVELRRWNSADADIPAHDPVDHRQPSDTADPSFGAGAAAPVQVHPPELPSGRDDGSHLPALATEPANDAEANLPRDMEAPTSAPPEAVSRVTEGDVQREILRLLGDGRAWTNAELKRTLADILPLSSADRAPANFRPGEEKWEELVNNALSPSRGNSLHSKNLVRSAGRGLHVLVGADTELDQVETFDPASSWLEHPGPPLLPIGQAYSFASLDVAPGDRDRLYNSDYQSRLSELIDEVLASEAPIYSDLLIERIARAHAKDRAGRVIQDLVTKALAPHHPRRTEGDRTVVFHRDMDAGRIVAYRPATSDWRSHRDIPIIELASLALPMVERGSSDEAIMAHFARTFDLSRLREPTRRRFEAAIVLARAARMGTGTQVRAGEVGATLRDAQG